MPAIIAKSISILSDAGLGMAMFSLGQDNSLLLFIFLAQKITCSDIFFAYLREKKRKSRKTFVIPCCCSLLCLMIIILN